MTRFQTFIAKAKVVLTAAPTYLAAFAAAVPLLLTVWVPLLPEHLAVRVTAVGAGAVAVTGAAIATIRILTPVKPKDRGLL